MLAALFFALPAAGRTGAPQRIQVPVVPHPRPALKSDTIAAPEQPMDLSHALPGSSLATLPPSQQQLGALNAELAKLAS